ncbi:hypothetical protein ACMSIO_05585 [Pseudomonas benzopyrenica]|uniref:hypothetical protein n=1 Tax=Pseudomonas benzopyrenica TaxID=2993566 RepID=UPI0039C11B18
MTDDASYSGFNKHMHAIREVRAKMDAIQETIDRKNLEIMVEQRRLQELNTERMRIEQAYWEWDHQERKNRRHNALTQVEMQEQMPD